MLNDVGIGISAFLTLTLFASLFERSYWIFSLFTHFREWYVFLFFVLILLSFCISRFRKTIVIFGFISMSFHFAMILPYWLPATEGLAANRDQARKSIQIFYANVNSRNQKKFLLIDHLRKSKPDLVMLVEITEPWIDQLKSLSNIYPYSKAIAKDSNFGMAILSKNILTSNTLYVDPANQIPALFIRAERAPSSFNLVLLHPHPPIGHDGTLMRDHYLETLSKKVRELESPVLLCGDFNTTPWTAIFREFTRKSGLDLASEDLLIRTWPTFVPFLGLPIDHCLSRGLRIANSRRGPDIGSDHWPLELEVE